MHLVLGSLNEVLTIPISMTSHLYKNRRVLAAGLLGTLLLAGCSSTKEIETAPPRPALPVHPDTTVTEPRAALSVVVETGQTRLPDAVQALRFRLIEVQLLSTEGMWVRYPADVNTFEIEGGGRTRKTVLSTQIPPAAYDSLALLLGDVFVQFDANAGGPLTLPRDTPLKMPVAMPLVLGRRTTLRLRFEAGASLSRTPDCRWLFLPFFDAEVH